MIQKPKKNFLLQITQNGPIRENEWFLAIFNFFSFTLVHQASRLSHFSENFENEVLVDFFDFGRLDMLDIAYSDSTNTNLGRVFDVDRETMILVLSSPGIVSLYSVPNNKYSGLI